MVFCGRILFMLALLVLAVLFLPKYAFAEIFKCEIEGKLVMQDMPCPDGVKQSSVDVVIKNDHQKVDPHDYDQSQFSDRENVLIKAGKVDVGMSVEALRQSWGSPQDINRSAYSPEQWVFRVGMYGHRYAYVLDGKVVNWQD
ncbi:MULTISPECIES: hypothetical protein [unclassified Shewanella]|uniref:hypothetical protein n=1 Tax=unclassified Shewanella TaxID=196818 RepID=UPI0021D82B44|nr:MULTISPECIES: hypothetical protein [unclassified Shewanella]MCU8024395.1 hypothetical protein [Shewanella sp. SM78]MCU8078513.1 hypothetical protein [Shewanella sp. SM103]